MIQPNLTYHQVLFSLIPPPGLMGGWLQFFTAMFLIGLMATLIGDLASAFGCVVGIQDSVTGSRLKDLPS